MIPWMLWRWGANLGDTGGTGEAWNGVTLDVSGVWDRVEVQASGWDGVTVSEAGAWSGVTVS
jgi:hypothetical protein